MLFFHLLNLFFQFIDFLFFLVFGQILIFTYILHIFFDIGHFHVFFINQAGQGFNAIIHRNRKTIVETKPLHIAAE